MFNNHYSRQKLKLQKKKQEESKIKDGEDDSKNEEIKGTTGIPEATIKEAEEIKNDSEGDDDMTIYNWNRINALVNSKKKQEEQKNNIEPNFPDPAGSEKPSEEPEIQPEPQPQPEPIQAELDNSFELVHYHDIVLLSKDYLLKSK